MKGSKDNVMNEFMGRPVIFADLFNARVYGGKQVIKPEDLVSADRLLSEIVGDGELQAKLTRFRDIFKIYRDENMTYVMLGIENQSAIHYAMPLRNMIYDALSLLAQTLQKQNDHLQSKDLKDTGEFLSRFAKADRIAPVVTLVVYYGSKPWTGPLTLHDMMLFPNDAIKRFVPNYFINLVAPVIMSDKDLEEFDTELCAVFGYIRYANDKERLCTFIQRHPIFETLSYDAVKAINTCTHANLKLTPNQEKLDMCQALIDIRQEGWDEGRASTIKETILRMHALPIFTLENIAAANGKTVEEVQAIINEAEKHKDA